MERTSAECRRRMLEFTVENWRWRCWVCRVHAVRVRFVRSTSGVKSARGDEYARMVVM